MTLSYDTTTWENKAYTFVVKVTDSSGRESTTASWTITTANTGPAVIWTSPANNSTVTGKIALKATATPASSGTSKITKWCLTINSEETNNYSAATFLGNDGYERDARNYYSMSSGCWGSASYDSRKLTLSYDTTTWENKSYTFVVKVTDSSGRESTTASVRVIIPAKPVLTLSVNSIQVGSPTTFSLGVAGTKSVSSAKVKLEVRAEDSDEWVAVADFKGNVGSLLASAQVELGQSVRASLSGSDELIDAVSDPIEIQVKPKVTCKLSSSIKAGSKNSGNCTSNVVLSNVPVTLYFLSGGRWVSLGGGTVNGKSFPINFTPKKKGVVYLAVISDGIAGKYSAFESNRVKVTVKQ